MMIGTADMLELSEHWSEKHEFHENMDLQNR